MHRILRLVAVVLALLTPGGGGAQVNIERLRPDAGEEGLSGSLGAALDVRTGSVSLVHFQGSGRLDHVRGPVTAFLLGSGEVGFQGGERFSNAWLAHLRAGYDLASPVDVEAYVQVNHDRARLLDFRALAGGGARVRLLTGEAATVRLGSGPMFEHERLDLPPGAAHPARTAVVRWSNYLTLQATPAPHLNLSLTGYFQPQLGRARDTRALAVSALAIDVTERLAVTVTFNLRHDSRPPADIAPTDTALRTGVTLALGPDDESS